MLHTGQIYVWIHPLITSSSSLPTEFCIEDDILSSKHILFASSAMHDGMQCLVSDHWLHTTFHDALSDSLYCVVDHIVGS